MLIEAQSQKLLSEKEISKEDEENKKDPLSMDIDEPKDSSTDDVEMGEADAKPPEELSKKPEAEDKAINIDPKTYCKLGHFHLLLEDYAKGKCYELHSY